MQFFEFLMISISPFQANLLEIWRTLLFSANFKHMLHTPTSIPLQSFNVAKLVGKYFVTVCHNISIRPPVFLPFLPSNSLQVIWGRIWNSICFVRHMTSLQHFSGICCTDIRAHPHLHPHPHPRENRNLMNRKESKGRSCVYDVHTSNSWWHAHLLKFLLNVDTSIIQHSKKYSFTWERTIERKSVCIRLGFMWICHHFCNCFKTTTQYDVCVGYVLEKYYEFEI